MPWTNKGKKNALGAIFNAVALPATFKFHLANSTPTVDTNTLADLTEASNYTALTYNKDSTDFPTLTEDDSGDLGSVAVKSLVFTAGGGTCTATHVVMCDAHATPASREVWAFWSLGGSQAEWKADLRGLGQARVDVPPRVIRDQQGILRIWVAPKLGYALPRIEYCHKDGTPYRRYESTDFQPIEGTLHFPRQTSITDMGFPEARRVSYQVLQISRVNQPVPATEFALKIPATTSVSDTRPGLPPARFRLDKQQQFEDLNRLLTDSSPPPRWPTWRLACVVLNGLLIVSLILLWVRRQVDLLPGGPHMDPN